MIERQNMAFDWHLYVIMMNEPCMTLNDLIQQDSDSTTVPSYGDNCHYTFGSSILINHNLCKNMQQTRAHVIILILHWVWCDGDMNCMLNSLLERETRQLDIIIIIIT